MSILVCYLLLRELLIKIFKGDDVPDEMCKFKNREINHEHYRGISITHSFIKCL